MAVCIAIVINVPLRSAPLSSAPSRLYRVNRDRLLFPDFLLQTIDLLLLLQLLVDRSYGRLTTRTDSGFTTSRRPRGRCGRWFPVQ